MVKKTKDEQHESGYWGYYSDQAWSFQVEIDKRQICFGMNSCTIYNGTTSIIIKVNDQTVFNAKTIANYANTTPTEREHIINVGGPEARTEIFVSSYIPGEWTAWLDSKIISESKYNAKKD